jgi:hypothetical protein
VFERVTQSNARFNALDKLTFSVDSVKMPVGFGKRALKIRGRPLSVMAHLKLSIVKLVTEENCLARALLIAVARLTNDPNYTAYRKGRKILPKVRELLEVTGVDLINGGGMPELTAFQRHFSQYKIVVYSGLTCDSIMYEGQVTSHLRINLMYDGEDYNVITNLTGAMTRRYVCPACNKGCKRGERHSCEATCNSCTASPPCEWDHARIPCDICNRHFRNATCFANHKRIKISGQKTVCEAKRQCLTCGALISEGHECYKTYCSNCSKLREVGHLCYMAPLVDRVPSSDRVLYVFYDFETTQNTACSETSSAYLHVPNLVCVQQFCAACENEPDIHVRCVRCGVRKQFLDRPGRRTDNLPARDQAYVYMSYVVSGSKRKFSMS